MEKTKRPWFQLSLRMLLIVAILSPPLIAGGYFVLRTTEAPFLAVVGSIAMVCVWTAILVRIVSGWVRPFLLQKPRDRADC